MRGSFRVEQQATLGANESGVPAVKVDRGWGQPPGWSTERRGCTFPLPSESIPSPPTQVFYRGGMNCKDINEVYPHRVVHRLQLLNLQWLESQLLWIPRHQRQWLTNVFGLLVSAKLAVVRMCEAITDIVLSPLKCLLFLSRWRKR